MKYVEKYKNEVSDFLDVCKRLESKMYTTSYGGNLSLKLENDLLLITPTTMDKGKITADDLVFIDLDGKIVEGKKQPTGETHIYLKFFKSRPDVKSIIHCHPPYTSVFAVTKEANILMRPTLPETCVEVGPVPLVPYGEPLTEELANNFNPFMQKYNAFLMESHGILIVRPEGIIRTMNLVEILEATSITLLNALKIGKIRELSKQDVVNLDNTIKTRKIPMIGAPGVNKSLVDMYF
jgi:L-fuculose-phosphate aldolase